MVGILHERFLFVLWYQSFVTFEVAMTFQFRLENAMEGRIIICTGYQV